jgi:hypothetical protein
MRVHRLLPVAVALILFIAVGFVFRLGPVMPLPMWVGYGVVLIAAVAAACVRWGGSTAPRLVMQTAVIGHLVAIIAFFASELVRADGVDRIGNSFRGLGFDFVLISLAYPLRFGGLIVGLGTGSIVALARRISKFGHEPVTGES